MRYALGFDTQMFSKNISEILECDYGDFMRAANGYLNNLRDELHALRDENIDRKLDEMQIYLQFTPTWDIELTKKLLRQDTKYLNELLHAHEQDWESESLKFNFLNSRPLMSDHNNTI